ncbi:17730_t:CDS:2, partial [Cetraspora pellucida]
IMISSIYYDLHCATAGDSEDERYNSVRQQMEHKKVPPFFVNRVDL